MKTSGTSFFYLINPPYALNFSSLPSCPLPCDALFLGPIVPMPGCSSTGMLCSPCWDSDFLCLKVEVTSYPACPSNLPKMAAPSPGLLCPPSPQSRGVNSYISQKWAHLIHLELKCSGKEDGGKMEVKGRGRRGIICFQPSISLFKDINFPLCTIQMHLIDFNM